MGYSVLAFTGGRLAVTSGGGGSPKDWTAWVLSLPFGWTLVMVVGIGVVGYGLHELYQTYQVEFEVHLNRGEMSHTVETWIINGGRFDLAARGVVIEIAGAFVTVSALRFDPKRPRAWAERRRRFSDSRSVLVSSAWWR